VVDFATARRRSWAAYGQTTYALTDQFDLTLGIRYTEDEKEAFLYNQNIAGFTKDDPAITADGEWDNISYKINGNYAFTDDISVYLTYATGYNGGGFNARASNVASFQTPFEEEEVETWELGLKSELLDNRLRLNAATVHQRLHRHPDSQFEAGTGGASSHRERGCGTYPGHRVRHRGGAGRWPDDRLHLRLPGRQVRRVHGAQPGDAPAGSDISRQHHGTAGSENTASLGVQYDFEPFSFGALSARVDVAYKDELRVPPVPEPLRRADRPHAGQRTSQPERHQAGLLRDRATLRVSLWGKNLTDEEYRNWGIDFGSLGWAGDDLRRTAHLRSGRGLQLRLIRQGRPTGRPLNQMRLTM
jgi:iron complex outermembrane receptor protein